MFDERGTVGERRKVTANAAHGVPEIGQALRAEREKRGLDRYTVAFRSGLSQRQIARIELGQALCANSLNKLLAALKVRLVVTLEKA